MPRSTASDWKRLAKDVSDVTTVSPKGRRRVKAVAKVRYRYRYRLLYYLNSEKLRSTASDWKRLAKDVTDVTTVSPKGMRGVKAVAKVNRLRPDDEYSSLHIVSGNKKCPASLRGASQEHPKGR